ncbi:hypothetical protein Taro_045520 [Colocasia esculenta]|uniref:RNase H type-1 domain-containing protein n=1 Tax=Colocasia esculenta TaxID=4460 RepID=A0A843X6L7_COLES|nr:hypothetical protein [Colocasia esculenta]
MAFRHCPMNLFTKFLTTYNSQDTWIWCPTQDGHFSTKSVRSILTTEADQQWAILWAPYIPTKWSVLVWRIILNAMPVDGTVKEQGIPLVSKCYCCSNPHEETTLHLFFKSAIVVQIWTELAHLLHFSHADMTSIADNLTDFLASREPEAAAARLIRCTFMSILWEIWCSRNKARFQDQGMSAKHIINRSLLSVRAICTSYKFQKIPPDWIAALRQDSTVKDNLNARIPSVVRWFTPPSGRLKLNVDGAFKSTSGEAGGGGIVRDQNGNMLCAFAHAYHGLNSSLAAEALAMRDGISMCCRNGISKVMIETDSHNLVQIMTAQQACHWNFWGDLPPDVKEIYHQDKKLSPFKSIAAPGVSGSVGGYRAEFLTAEQQERFTSVKIKVYGNKAADIANFQKNGMGSIITVMERMKWTKLESLSEVSYLDLVKAFYVCLKTEEDGSLTSTIKGTQIKITCGLLESLFDVCTISHSGIHTVDI